MIIMNNEYFSLGYCQQTGWTEKAFAQWLQENDNNE